MLKEQLAKNLSTQETASRLSQHLSKNSTPYTDPLSQLNWSELNFNAFWLPEQAISIYGTTEYQQLSRVQKIQLSQCEFINFIQAGFWLETLFMARISNSLRIRHKHISESIYHLHELREEAGHSLMFLELIKRCVQFSPNTDFHKLNFANFIARFARFDSLAFWIAVLVGEETPDRINRMIRKHHNEICPVIYKLSTIHSIDEARHIAHAKEVIQQRVTSTGTIQKFFYNRVLSKVTTDFVSAFYYPKNTVYYTAGLSQSTDWERLTKASMTRNKFVSECIQPTLRTLRNCGIDIDLKV
ncbi:MAG: diiron oxygenase [Gammaproteobacteria bacterium]|nr:diiron oxygenase [Gammaproteobacteria bacterium]MDH5694303.1 diiron oxygenase [Gammaproteobacteria bacterium]